MKMHHRYSLASILLSFIIFLTSCQKRLSDEYLDPNGFTKPAIEGFYLNLLQSGGLIRPEYGQYYYTFQTFNPMTGAGGFVNDGVQNTFAWGYDQFSSYYGFCRHIIEMNRLYDGLSVDEKAEYRPYMITSEVIEAYIFYQLTETYNSIPYFDALKGKDGNYFPKYDSQSKIYTDLLSKLSAVSETLKNYSLGDSYIEQKFSSYDVLFDGNISLWRSFTNSLRLRIAIHLTNELPEVSKSVIKEVLADGVYAKDRATSIIVEEKDQTQAESGLYWRSMVEMRDYFWMPGAMMSLLRKDGQADDPRLPVLFQPDKHGKYSAMPSNGPYDAAFRDSITNVDLSKTFPSIYNRTTFEQNFAMPYQVITATEIHLILAEAAVRWSDLGLDATAEYANAINQSIDLYYEFNALNTKSYTNKVNGSQPVKPNQTLIDSFLGIKKSEFTSAAPLEKIGLIYDQKFIDFNVLKPYELWTETRRLIKELGEARVEKKPSNIRLMERSTYPTSEASNNYDNFEAVTNENNFTTTVWFTGR